MHIYYAQRNALTDVTAGRDNHTAFSFRDGGQRLCRHSTLLFAHPALEHKNVLGASLHRSREKFEMLFTSRK